MHLIRQANSCFLAVKQQLEGCGCLDSSDGYSFTQWLTEGTQESWRGTTNPGQRCIISVGALVRHEEILWLGPIKSPWIRALPCQLLTLVCTGLCRVSSHFHGRDRTQRKIKTFTSMENARKDLNTYFVFLINSLYGSLFPIEVPARKDTYSPRQSMGTGNRCHSPLPCLAQREWI